MLVVTDVNADFGQRGIVEGTECIEIFRIDFGGTVSSHQFVLEEDADFRYDRRAVGMLGGCDFDGGDQIFFSVGSQCTDGELRAGQDDRFGQVSSIKLKAEAV